MPLGEICNLGEAAHLILLSALVATQDQLEVLGLGEVRYRRAGGSTGF